MAKKGGNQPSEVELLQEAFFNFDEDKDFYLTLEELRQIVTSDGDQMHDLEEFMQEAGQFSDGTYVDYRAFAACMCAEDE